MNKRCFIDTCVFFAFASPFPFEPFNQACTKFFEKGYEYYTGKRVIKELNIRWRRRQRVYEDLSKLNGSIDVTEILSMELNANDEKHFCGVVGFLKATYPTHEILNQLRDMQRVIGKGLDEAEKKIKLPFIEEFDDPVSYAILAYTENQNDALILTDALCWSEKKWEEDKQETTFGTLDYNDIVTKLPDIIRVICNNRDCQESDIPLHICSIMNIR